MGCDDPRLQDHKVDSEGSCNASASANPSIAHSDAAYIVMVGWNGENHYRGETFAHAV